jgi:hypothetical protein
LRQWTGETHDEIGIFIGTFATNERPPVGGTCGSRLVRNAAFDLELNELGCAATGIANCGRNRSAVRRLNKVGVVPSRTAFVSESLVIARRTLHATNSQRDGERADGEERGYLYAAGGMAESI